MEVMLLASGAFLFGTALALVFCLYMIFDSHKKHLSHIHQQNLDLQEDLKEHIEEFKEVAAKASLANQSLGQAIVDFDIKLKDLETRIAMSRMQR